MTDSLRDRLAYACKDVLRPALSEAEKEKYPYAVYDITTTALRDKDGIYAFSGDTTIRVVSNADEEVDTNAAAIQNAIATGMNDEFFSSRLVDCQKECVDGIWTIEMTYTLKQYADWAEPVEQVNTD